MGGVADEEQRPGAVLATRCGARGGRGSTRPPCVDPRREPGTVEQQSAVRRSARSAAVPRPPRPWWRAAARSRAPRSRTRTARLGARRRRGPPRGPGRRPARRRRARPPGRRSRHASRRRRDAGPCSQRHRIRPRTCSGPARRHPPGAAGPRRREHRSLTSTSSTPRSISIPRSASASDRTALHHRLPFEEQVRERGVGESKLPSRTGISRRPRWRWTGGATSPLARSASVTPSGRSTSRVRGCTISARDGRNASVRRSTTRTRAPWSCACSARARPVGPAPTTTTSVVAHGAGTSVEVRRHHAPDLVRRDGVGELRIGEQLVATVPGQHRIVDRCRDADEREHPPECADVGLGQCRIVPVVEPSVDAVVVVGEPQLGHEAWEAGEQHRVEHALQPEQRRAPARCARGAAGSRRRARPATRLERRRQRSLGRPRPSCRQRTNIAGRRVSRAGGGADGGAAPLSAWRSGRAPRWRVRGAGEAVRRASRCSAS